MSVFFAKPLELWPQSKALYLVDRMAEHEAAWNDFQTGRREITWNILCQPANVFFEVWAVGGRESQPSGIIYFSDLILGVEAKGHFLFFDGRLKGKEHVLRQSMKWAFENLSVHRLAAEIPADSFALVDFSRKHLGLRFEAESRTIQERAKRKAPDRSDPPTVTPNAREASWGSRKYQAVRRRGLWLDVLLLSITDGEFQAAWERWYGSGTRTPCGDGGIGIAGRIVRRDETEIPAGESAAGRP